VSETNPIHRERQILRSLGSLAAQRVETHRRIEAEFAARNADADAEFQGAEERITAAFQRNRDATQAEYDEVRRTANLRFESETSAAEREFAATLEKAQSAHNTDVDRTRRECDEARWEATAVADAARTDAKDKLAAVQTVITGGLERLRTVEDEAIRVLDRWNLRAVYTPTPLADNPSDDAVEVRRKADEAISLAGTLLHQLAQLRSPRLLAGHRLRWVFLGLWLVALTPAAVWRDHWLSIVAGVMAAMPLVSWLGRLALVAVAKRLVDRVHNPLCQVISDGERLSRFQLARVEAEYKRQCDEIQQRLSHEVAQIEERTRVAQQKLRQRLDNATIEAKNKYPALLNQIRQRRDTTRADADRRYPQLLAKFEQQFDAELKEVTEAHPRKLSESRATHEREWDAMARTWLDGQAHVRSEIDAVAMECGRLFPDWRLVASPDWTAPQALPPAIRFGAFHVYMNQIPHGVPDDSRLQTNLPPDFSLPALLPFPAGCSMVIRSADEGRSRAIETLQLAMLRFLTCVPPGKVRFTIIDPVGLGENFAAFMHLADHDEQLVTNRIWTEPQHIEQRLVDLTEHMENVIQKYLRNEFQTIEQYNAEAGEVAEPFRIVVVANFPASFNESSTRRLLSIANSGARCGVFTLISVDTRLPLPSSFQLADLEQNAVKLAWKDKRFVWNDPDFEQYNLTLDKPPHPDTVTSILSVVGREAKEASRVEVPFEFVAPSPAEYWAGASHKGVAVPLGRAGATKRQFLRLGSGTSQHVLIAGKTGSGKSTLLHALITNLALAYSPEEIELYLVDFKKGVEFKTYASYELPHARVIAVESEREFGLSVLQRLDAELKRRGDLYRQVGAQDVASYRESNGNQPLARILLVVDEFQEFFVEDDKIAQEATLLLDRLVRQGRAFGIHVQLGSQTLGGAYSLARSTLGQMAVRIALQCSESDAHLILSDNNTAARLLSRPGEAIYNDANGLIEGNNFFQVVWLSEDKREEYLRRIQQLARDKHYRPPAPQIVFEGNAPSEMRKNHLLERLLDRTDWPPATKVSYAWMGEAVAIKDPTAAAFRPQGGSNLLMVGQQAEAAIGIMYSAVVSLAAQHPPTTDDASGGGRFHVLDGSPVDSPHRGMLGKLADVIPHPISVAAVTEVASVMNAIGDEVERRQQSGEQELPPIFLLIYDVQRFRDLRKADDDFGFSRRGEEKVVSPAKRLGAILRDGPAVRVHTIIWCDSLNNLNRTFDRQTTREFDMRVLFQMSAGDSSTLIDSPAASKLGLYRAIYFSEELSEVEKFRPYGLPSREWWQHVQDRLAAKQPAAV
jgi:energy-coupling factor transporter ATP-binding protein EcfA2